MKQNLEYISSEFANFLKDNEAPIKALLLPETWTHEANINKALICSTLKQMGLDWFLDEHYVYVMEALEDTRLMLRDNWLLKANPHQAFQIA